jgi:mRNA-degrading endonuclease RelE of RelBE toxin-antitoxin system
VIRYRVIIPPEIREVVTHLPPTIKQKFRESLRFIETDPLAGKALERELSGYHSYPIQPFRIVYRIEPLIRTVHIVIVAHRKEAYDLLAEKLQKNR